MNLEIDSIEVYTVTDLLSFDEKAKQIVDKYGINSDETRWSLKPIILSFMLQKHKSAKVIYCDCDFFFCQKPIYLLNCLESGSIVLTPHWRPLTPRINKKNFHLNFQDGLFNAGCISVNINALPALNWWAEVCLDACEMNREGGLWHDQRYLDLMIIYFPDVVICRDRSYNIADWNLHLRNEFLECGNQPIDYPVTLIHFTKNTIKRIEQSEDAILNPYYRLYQTKLKTSIDLILQSQCLL